MVYGQDPFLDPYSHMHSGPDGQASLAAIEAASWMGYEQVNAQLAATRDRLGDQAARNLVDDLAAQSRWQMDGLRQYPASTYPVAPGAYTGPYVGEAVAPPGAYTITDAVEAPAASSVPAPAPDSAAYADRASQPTSRRMSKDEEQELLARIEARTAQRLAENEKWRTVATDPGPYFGLGFHVQPSRAARGADNLRRHFTRVRRFAAVVFVTCLVAAFIAPASWVTLVTLAGAAVSAAIYIKSLP